jgi:membrane-associated phospholipid phosphatase
MDKIILNWFQDHHNNSVYMHLIHLGTYPVLLILCLFCIGTLSLEKQYQKAAVVVSSIFVVCSITEFIKLFGRSIAPDLIVEYPYTFPNGFSIATMSVYLIIAQSIPFIHKRFLIIFSFLLTILIDVAKITTGVNYFSDILIGWILGISIGIFYYYINKNLEKYQLKTYKSFLD